MSYEAKNYIFFYEGQLAILLYKIGWCFLLYIFSLRSPACLDGREHKMLKSFGDAGLHIEFGSVYLWKVSAVSGSTRTTCSSIHASYWDELLIQAVPAAKFDSEPIIVQSEISMFSRVIRPNLCRPGDDAPQWPRGGLGNQQWVSVGSPGSISRIDMFMKVL